MATSTVATQLKNLDQRLNRVEQILPTLATKDDLRREIDRAVAPLATKAELFEMRDELRRHMDVIAESLQTSIDLLAEHVVRIASKVYGK